VPWDLAFEAEINRAYSSARGRAFIQEWQSAGSLSSPLFQLHIIRPSPPRSAPLPRRVCRALSWCSQQTIPDKSWRQRTHATSAMDMTPGLESDTHTPSHAMSIPYPHSGSSQTPQAQDLTIQQQAQSQASGQPKFSNGPHIRSRITVVCAEVSTLPLYFLGNPSSLERHVQPTRLLLLFISQNNRNNRQ